MSPRTALAAGLLAAALLSAGCGADIDVRDPDATATTQAPATTAAPTTAATTPAPTTGTSSGTGSGPAGALPATFPLPPGATVQRVVTDTTQISATVTVPDGRQAYAYWNRALPAAGYTVGQGELVGGIGVLPFSGPGCPGSGEIGFSMNDVSVRCATG